MQRLYKHIEPAGCLSRRRIDRAASPSGVPIEYGCDERRFLRGTVVVAYFSPIVEQKLLIRLRKGAFIFTIALSGHMFIILWSMTWL
jgi:hypothetical protein